VKIKNKYIELFVDVDIDEGSIYVEAEDQISEKVLKEINVLWMDYQSVPNLNEEIKIEFAGMELFLVILEKIYSSNPMGLEIELTLKLLE
jgi:hypothetical protein